MSLEELHRSGAYGAGLVRREERIAMLYAFTGSVPITSVMPAKLVST